MSIKVTYPSSGTMRIECDGDVVDIPIHGNVIQQDQAGSTADNVPRWTSPKPGPGVGFVTVGAGEHTCRTWDPKVDDLFKVDIGPIGNHRFIDQLNAQILGLNGLIASVGKSSVVLNVHMQPSSPPIDVSTLQAIVKNPDSGIDGFRLFPTPAGGSK